ncbi:MAG: glycosyltransferase [Porticoccaceae bacterium]|nr:glycosyltransferase [Porticoccaceae bacterium]
MNHLNKEIGADMSKILCISAHTSPTQGFGGPAVVFRTFLNFLSDEGRSFVSLSTTDKNTYSETEGASKSIYFRCLFFFKYGLSIHLLLYMVCIQHKFRYFAVNGLSNFPVFFASLLACLLNKKVVLFTHGGLEVSRTADWFILKRLLYRLNILILRCLDMQNNLLVVYQSKDEQSKSSFKSGRSIICANYPESFFNKKSRKDFSKLAILYVGRFSREKGSNRLIKLLDFYKGLTLKSRDTITLVIASEDAVKELEGYQEIEGISIVYNLSWPQLSEALDKSNVLYFPSVTENFGNSLVEGVAYGLVPCIYQDTHWSVLLEKDSAILEPSLRELLDSNDIDEAALSEMSARVQDVVVNEFIRNKDMSQILDFLK